MPLFHWSKYYLSPLTAASILVSRDSQHHFFKKAIKSNCFPLSLRRRRLVSLQWDCVWRYGDVTEPLAEVTVTCQEPRRGPTLPNDYQPADNLPWWCEECPLKGEVSRSSGVMTSTRTRNAADVCPLCNGRCRHPAWALLSTHIDKATCQPPQNHKSRKKEKKHPEEKYLRWKRS